MSTTPTWYDLLDVERTASTDEIRTAWRAAIADLEPTERRFATLNEAAAVLLDPARRSGYDDELRAAEPEPEPEVEPEPGPEVEVRGAPATSLEASAEDPEEQATEEKPRKAPYLVSGWLLAVLAVIALVCVVLAAVLVTRPSPVKVIQADAQLSGGTKVTQVEEQALDAQSAAKEAIVPILSYDYRQLAADQAKAHNYMTDGYRQGRDGKKGYDDLFDALKASATSTQTVVTTKVISSAIVRADSDRVQVLVFFDQSRTNKASSTPAVFQNQATVTMQKVGSRWLVDDIVTSQIPD